VKQTQTLAIIITTEDTNIRYHCYNESRQKEVSSETRDQKHHLEGNVYRQDIVTRICPLHESS